MLSTFHIHEGSLEDYYGKLLAYGDRQGRFWDAELNGHVILKYSYIEQLMSSGSLARGPVSLPSLTGYDELVVFVESVVGNQLHLATGEDAMLRRRYWTSKMKSNMESVLKKVRTEVDHKINCSLGKRVDLYNFILRPVNEIAAFTSVDMSEAHKDLLRNHAYNYVNWLDGKVRSMAEHLQFLISVASLFNFASSHLGIPDSFDWCYPRGTYIGDLLLVLAAGQESSAYTLSTILSQQTTHRYDLISGEVLFWEAVRFDSPIQMIGRILSDDIIVGDAILRKGEKVFLHIGAGNRDPLAFEQPELFNPKRKGRSRISFGYGSFSCLGAFLAEAVVCEVIKAFRERNVVCKNIVRESMHGLNGRGLSGLYADLMLSD